MKLATNGTLDTRAIIPMVVRTLKKLAMLAFIESKFRLKIPVYANISMVAMIIPTVNAIPEALLTSWPAK